MSKTCGVNKLLAEERAFKLRGKILILKLKVRLTD